MYDLCGPKGSFWAKGSPNEDLPTTNKPFKFLSLFARKQIFRVFREWQTSPRKTPIISGTMIDRTNPKTAFEIELNSPSQYCRQI